MLVQRFVLPPLRFVLPNLRFVMPPKSVGVNDGVVLPPTIFRPNEGSIRFFYLPPNCPLTIRSAALTNRVTPQIGWGKRWGCFTPTVFGSGAQFDRDRDRPLLNRETEAGPEHRPAGRIPEGFHRILMI